MGFVPLLAFSQEAPNLCLMKASDTLDDDRQDLLKDKAQALKETAQQWQRQATDATRKAAQATDVYVRENTWTAIACVAGFCFTFGFLLGRSRS